MVFNPAGGCQIFKKQGFSFWHYLTVLTIIYTFRFKLISLNRQYTRHLSKNTPRKYNRNRRIKAHISISVSHVASGLFCSFGRPSRKGYCISPPDILKINIFENSRYLSTPSNKYPQNNNIKADQTQTIITAPPLFSAKQRNHGHHSPD